MALSADQHDNFGRNVEHTASSSSNFNHFGVGDSNNHHQGRQYRGRGSGSRNNHPHQITHSSRGRWRNARAVISDSRGYDDGLIREPMFGGDVRFVRDQPNGRGGIGMGTPGNQFNGHRDPRRWDNPVENQTAVYSEHRDRRGGASGFYHRSSQVADSRREFLVGERVWRTREGTGDASNSAEERRGLVDRRFDASSTSINRDMGERNHRRDPPASGSHAGDALSPNFEIAALVEHVSTSVSLDHASAGQTSFQIRRQANGRGRHIERERERRDLKNDLLNAERSIINDGGRNRTIQTNNACGHELKFRHEKGSIPQLVQELEDKLTRGKIECMICCEIVGRSVATWSCSSCYSMFHLTCIRKWAQAPSSTNVTGPASRCSDEGNWRCPGCQSVQSVSARDLRYYCFCGKIENPSVDHYLTPHSCGEPCQKPLDKNKLGKCKHLCTLQCHPGPCPPCAALAPPESCSCGKNTFTRRCSEQEKGAICCGKPCARLLRCGRHLCKSICHEGSCDMCDVLLAAKCFCGKVLEKLQCGQLDIQGKLDFEMGIYSCGHTCGKKLSCQNHSCADKCHPGACEECELSPSKIQTCCCGKRPLKDMFGHGSARRSCLDPVPSCGQICGKLLPCKQHYCQSICHSGSCPLCMESVEQKCRCRSTSRTVPCHVALSSEQANAGSGEPLLDHEAFLCDKVCGKKKNCGKHRCNNRCCQMYPPDAQARVFENVAVDEHVCPLICSKKLRCGKHNCQELCHAGHCPPCLESTFTELSCACGRSFIPPPVPCGTPLPSCEYPCSIPQPCGHPATHSCHFGDCPPCTVTTSKECVGNHVIVRNVPCGSREIKCNKLCGKARQCGLHACARTCHLPPCDLPVEDTSNRISSGKVRPSCGQPCGAPRRDCPHTCAALCHPSVPCPEAWCRTLVQITCSCGRLSAEVPCAAGGLIDNEIEAKVLARLPGPIQPLETREKVPLGQRKLQCDNECAKVEKKRVLADAFNVSVSGESLSAYEGTSASSEILEMIKKDPQFVSAVEDRFRFLVLGPKRPAGSTALRLHVFCGLSIDKRELIHQLAERWSLAVNSVGREPRRCVIVHVTSRSKVPSKGLVSKGLPSVASIPPFNALIDMEPGLVVGLFDLPRDADVSTLVLRFGGECELAWLNDKNALAIFGDGARAATALRRVDHASQYYGAVASPSTAVASRSGWGVSVSSSTGKSVQKKKTLQESSWVEDAWDEDEKAGKDHTPGVWQSKVGSIVPSKNPWGALGHVQATAEASQTSSSIIPQPAANNMSIPGGVEDEHFASGIKRAFVWIQLVCIGMEVDAAQWHTEAGRY